MKVLIVGGGGREHAIIASLKKSSEITELHCAPGNGGISELATCHNVKATDIDGMLKLAKNIEADYVFVASDDPLVLGMVDDMEKHGFKTFGPRKNAAIIEGSKVFSKAFMKRNGIPTADYETFSNAEEAIAYIKERNTYPVVVKCDGLALGKGAVIVKNLKEAETTVNEIMLNGKFGGSGNEIVVEEFMEGVEVTVMAFTDGKTVYPMIASTDHKRAYDDDKGLNTGGMGVIAPTPYYTERYKKECLEKIINPTISALTGEGRPFKGCIYFEMMLTPQGTRVIEYNCRFGDPEAQAVLPLLKTDLFEIVKAINEERLSEINLEWENASSACVIMASGGYPEKYETGKIITGLEKIKNKNNVTVYHAGTALQNGTICTSGGRVLGITATGKSLSEALSDAYSAVSKVDFEKAHYRHDIGKKALDYMNS